MELPKTLTVTSQEIDISALSQKQIVYYTQLADYIIDIYTKAKIERAVIGLSGPAGAGKSVVTQLLTHIFKTKKPPFEYMNIGLDAFHYSNNLLDEKELRHVKGRHDTYNTDLLIEKLTQFAKGGEVTFPKYSRETHNPVADAVHITKSKTLILLEGQWLLRDPPKWHQIRDLCIHQFLITGSEEILRENVIKRHTAGGRSKTDAETFYQNSDYQNTLEILKNSVSANDTLLFYVDI